MWRAYAGANGVAIESTYGRLRSVLPDWIFIHEVEYIDYERDRMIALAHLQILFACRSSVQESAR
jgi:hypothetical protein